MPHARIGDTIAAIDLGSNSFHLAIARVLENRVQMLHRVKHRVQLAEGMDSNGNLAEAAIQRGLDCIGLFAQHLETSQIEQVRVVATYALRRAPNRKAFIKKASKLLNTQVEVIAGSEEARLIFQGVAQAMELKGHSLTIDIGGGSTELIVGKGRSALLMESLDMGCVSFHDRYFSDKLSRKQFDKAIVAAQQQLEPLLERYLKHGWQQIIGCSGTIKALCSVCNDSDLTVPLTLTQLKQLQRELINDPQLPALTELGESRRKVIPAGLAILIACFRSLNLTEISFCSAALREGVIVEMSGDQDHNSVCRETVAAMERLHHVDTQHGELVAKTAQQLFSTSPYHKRQHQLLLKWAARLLEVGLSMNFRGMHRHTGYILDHSNLPGFTVEQQQVLGWLGRFQRKRLDECSELDLQLIDGDTLRHMLVSLRLAAIWHLGRRNQELQPSLSWHRSKLVVSLPEGQEFDTLLLADLEQEQQRLTAIDWKLELLTT
ncbi:Ppx/GppA phosphatase family protein [Ferrimonas lipolytica]|uniref:Ppx/GppA family phosphatase n=1 Tax=Ferrimonas lipolytica TaxID=2724191 RepID=A0A6H1UEK9_9GAMM|nr:Ppx/GppA phosphatase family protein [Ferrimonas lipolytica]QIZ77030.1 Ppx/GppA family phosphatase [Ferrimonas lipolytica]